VAAIRGTVLIVLCDTEIKEDSELALDGKEEMSTVGLRCLGE
jgi:hypothetical protein